MIVNDKMPNKIGDLILYIKEQIESWRKRGYSSEGPSAKDKEKQSFILKKPDGHYVVE